MSLSRRLRRQQTPAGLLMQDTFTSERLTYVRHSGPVLRMGDAGPAEAERAARGTRILSGVPGLDEVLQQRPLFGRRAQ